MRPLKIKYVPYLFLFFLSTKKIKQNRFSGSMCKVMRFNQRNLFLLFFALIEYRLGNGLTSFGAKRAIYLLWQMRFFKFRILFDWLSTHKKAIYQYNFLYYYHNQSKYALINGFICWRSLLSCHNSNLSIICSW